MKQVCSNGLLLTQACQGCSSRQTLWTYRSTSLGSWQRKSSHRRWLRQHTTTWLSTPTRCGSCLTVNGTLTSVQSPWQHYKTVSWLRSRTMCKLRRWKAEISSISQPFQRARTVNIYGVAMLAWFMLWLTMLSPRPIWSLTTGSNTGCFRLKISSPKITR